jgi:hypothetical protein
MEMEMEIRMAMEREKITKHKIVEIKGSKNKSEFKDIAQKQHKNNTKITQKTPHEIAQKLNDK